MNDPLLGPLPIRLEPKQQIRILSFFFKSRTGQELIFFTNVKWWEIRKAESRMNRDPLACAGRHQIMSQGNTVNRFVLLSTAFTILYGENGERSMLSFIPLAERFGLCPIQLQCIYSLSSKSFVHQCNFSVMGLQVARPRKNQALLIYYSLQTRQRVMDKRQKRTKKSTILFYWVCWMIQMITWPMIRLR